MIYENGALSKILTEEGYITLSGTTPTYHYYLKDHLGNNRVVLNQNGTAVEQVNHYYPFGGLFDQTSETLQAYKYNGKELDRTYGIDLYDYSARFMDGAVGRFTTMDPLSEKKPWLTPYHYCSNNPMIKIDPTGLIDYRVHDNGYIFDDSTIGDKIRRFFKGPDKTDRLIAPNGKTLTVDAGVMTNFTDIKNEKGLTDAQTFTVNSWENAEIINDFLSSNVGQEREFGVIDALNEGVQSSTMTWKDEKNTNNSIEIAEGLLNKGVEVIQITHSHPRNDLVSSPDIKAAEYLNNKFPGNNIEHRVYNPNKKIHQYYNETGTTKTEKWKHRK